MAKNGFHPKFAITNLIANDLTQIERARGFLEAATLSEDWIQAMGERALVLEAHHTTHIEGTALTLEQAEDLLSGKDVKGADPNDARELLNYRKAFDFVSEYMESEAPMTEGLIREIHKRLVKGVRGDSAAPGKYRQVQNYVVSSATHETIYTPPPPQDVPILMDELVEWIKQSKKVHPVLLSGIAQFQLVHVHPFRDGNGRTSRLLSTLCLYRAGYDFKRLFTISEYYDRDRTAFYRAIQSVREANMDMTGWLEYFVRGLATQMREVVRRGKVAIGVDVYAREFRLSKRQAFVLEQLIERETLTIRELEGFLPKVSRRSLQRDLSDLMGKGLVTADGATNRLLYKPKRQ